MGDMSQPIRTCVGCRAKDARSALIRLVRRDTRVVVDTGACAPGRGAWMHDDPQCYGTARRRRSIERALRCKGTLNLDVVDNWFSPTHVGKQLPPSGTDY